MTIWSKNCLWCEWKTVFPTKRSLITLTMIFPWLPKEAYLVLGWLTSLSCENLIRWLVQFAWNFYHWFRLVWAASRPLNSLAAFEVCIESRTRIPRWIAWGRVSVGRRRSRLDASKFESVFSFKPWHWANGYLQLTTNVNTQQILWGIILW